MDFSDQIALGARLADEQPEVGAGGARQVPRRPARRVPGHLGRAGPDAEPAVLGPGAEQGTRPPGHRGRRPQPGDLRLARARRCRTSSASATTSPAPRRRRGAELPVDASTGARTGGSSTSPTGSPPRCTPRFPQVRAAGGRAPARPRATCGRSCTRPTPTSSPGWPSEVQEAHDGPLRAAVARGSGCWCATTTTRPPSSTRCPAAEIPVEIVGLQGLLRLPEVAEVVATLNLLHDLTANAALLTLLTGPRWAIGPRDLALLGRRAARAGRRRPGRAGPRAAWTSPRPRCSGRRRRRPDRGRAPSATRSTTPARLPYSDGRPGAVRAAGSRAADLRAHAGEPLLDLVRRIIDTSGIDVELASSVSPAARARRENLDLFVKAVARVPGHRRHGHPARAAGLPGGRGRARQRARRRRALRRPTRSSC